MQKIGDASDRADELDAVHAGHLVVGDHDTDLGSTHSGKGEGLRRHGEVVWQASYDRPQRGDHQQVVDFIIVENESYHGQPLVFIVCPSARRFVQASSL